MRPTETVQQCEHYDDVTGLVKQIDLTLRAALEFMDHVDDAFCTEDRKLPDENRTFEGGRVNGENITEANGDETGEIGQANGAVDPTMDEDSGGCRENDEEKKSESIKKDCRASARLVLVECVHILKEVGLWATGRMAVSLIKQLTKVDAHVMDEMTHKFMHLSASTLSYVAKLANDRFDREVSRMLCLYHSCLGQGIRNAN